MTRPKILQISCYRRRYIILAFVLSALIVLGAYGQSYAQQRVGGIIIDPLTGEQQRQQAQEREEEVVPDGIVSQRGQRQQRIRQGNNVGIAANQSSSLINVPSLLGVGVARLQNVELDGGLDVYQPPALRPIYQDLIGEYISMEMATQIARRLQAQLNRDGLNEYRITAPVQDVSTGVLRLRILPPQVGVDVSDGQSVSQAAPQTQTVPLSREVLDPESDQNLRDFALPLEQNASASATPTRVRLSREQLQPGSVPILSSLSTASAGGGERPVCAYAKVPKGIVYHKRPGAVR